MAGREVCQLAQDAVAAAGVERRGLETEGIEEGGAAAAAHGFLLCRGQEAVAVPVAVAIFADPERVDEEPTPDRLAGQATGERAIGIPEEKREGALIAGWGVGAVDGGKTLAEGLDVGRIGSLSTRGLNAGSDRVRLRRAWQRAAGPGA